MKIESGAPLGRGVNVRVGGWVSELFLVDVNTILFLFGHNLYQ